MKARKVIGVILALIGLTMILTIDGSFIATGIGIVLFAGGAWIADLYDKKSKKIVVTKVEDVK